MPKESVIERVSCNKLKTLGALALKLTNVKGIPDRVVLWLDSSGGPRYFFIEFKTATGRLSPAQKARALLIPGTVYVCRSVDEAASALEEERRKYNVESKESESDTEKVYRSDG